MSRGQMSRATRWPALDGLRALAILLVVGEHTGVIPSETAAGTAGVTIFFVLSGFLITGVIRRDLEADRWSFWTFFGNRVFRLVPALLVMVLIVSIVCLVVGRSGDLGPQAASAVLYLEDFLHVRHNYGVFSHTWSLAVEEQFYLVWPFVLPWLLRRGRRTAGVVLGGAMLVSVAGRLVLAKAGYVDFSYAFILTNAYALLAGCALNVLGVRLPLRVSPVVVGYGALAALAVLIAGTSQLPQSHIVAPVLVTVVAVPLLLALLDGNRLFDNPVAVFLGRVSYAWYLWHWPLMWLTRTLDRPLAGTAVSLGALAAGTVSTLLLEEPLRRWWHARRREVPVLGPGPGQALAEAAPQESDGRSERSTHGG